MRVYRWIILYNSRRLRQVLANPDIGRSGAMASSAHLRETRFILTTSA
jgi:hypothetical protein